jgi:hypothetical protein
MMMLNNKNERQHRSSTLEIILAVVAIASILVLSVLVLITTILKANAAAESTTFSLDQTQTNKCNDFVGCANIGTITFLSDHIILHDL